MNRRDVEKAIRAEVKQWPGATVEFDNGSKHPVALLSFDGLTQRRAFAVPVQSLRFPNVAVAAMREVLRNLGAKRKEEPKDPAPEEGAEEPEPKGHHVRNRAGVAAREPVEGEPGPVKPSMAEQISEAIGPAVVAVNQLQVAVAEYLGAGEWDIPEDLYHADPCPEPSLSSSIAKVMIDRSCWHGWHNHPRLNPHFEREEKAQFDLGSAFHKEILGKGADLAVFGYKNWQTQAAKDDRDAARKAGMIPILQDQHERVIEMARSARWQMGYRKELALAMAGGSPERTLIWQEETPHGSVWCRLMLDWQPHGGVLFPDWKSTEAAAGTKWGERTMWDLQADVQDAFYRRGVKKVLARDMDLLFAVVEVKAPYAMATHRVDPESQAEADRMVQWAINAFAMCRKYNHWPGYTTTTQWQMRPRYMSQMYELHRMDGKLDEEALDAHLANLRQISTVKPRTSAVEVTDDNPFGLPPLPAETTEPTNGQ